MRHTYLPGWYLPGGGVERRESLEEAITRELWEEVGVTPRGSLDLFHAYSNLSRVKSDHVMVYTLRQFDMAPNPNLEIAEHGFFDPDSPPEGISPATLRRLEEWRGRAPRAHFW